MESATTSCAPTGALSIERIDDDRGALWDGFLAGHPQGSFYHLYGWRHINETSFGHRTLYLAAMRSGQLQGVLPLVLVRSRLFGRILCTLPFVNFGGIVAVDADTEARLLEAAVATARAEQADLLEIRTTRPLDTTMAVSLHKVSLTLQLDPDPERLWAAFSSKHRTNIRRGMKNGTRITAGGIELLDAFYEVMAESWRNLGTPIYHKSYFQRILRQFPDQTRLFVCSHDDRPVAVAFNGEFNGVVEGMWMGSRPEARNLLTSYTLYWEMIRDACARGFSVYHLGRSSVDSGGELFKKKWNAATTQLYWYQQAPRGGSITQLRVSNPRFRLAIATWRRLPVRATTLIGPLVARSIP
jgi:FemAB-related protein (PEP-CTERM system-associated)